MRRHPLLDVEPHPVGLLGMGQRMALHLAQRADLGFVERVGPIAAAVEEGRDLTEAQLVDQHQLRRKSPVREWLGHAGLVVLSVVLVLVLLELGLRAATGWLFDWHNLVLGARTVHSATEQGRFPHDALVGYVPRPDGFRPTDEAPGVPILAVGDSYAYGEEVGDGRTWPALLPRPLNQRVLNAGVSGHRFDQSGLRAAQSGAARRPPAVRRASIRAD